MWTSQAYADERGLHAPMVVQACCNHTRSVGAPAAAPTWLTVTASGSSVLVHSTASSDQPPGGSPPPSCAATGCSSSRGCCSTCGSTPSPCHVQEHATRSSSCALISAANRPGPSFARLVVINTCASDGVLLEHLVVVPAHTCKFTVQHSPTAAPHLAGRAAAEMSLAAAPPAHRPLL